MKQSLKNYKRVVIKIGSSLFCSDKNKIEAHLVDSITGQICELIKEGKEIVLVSSGAIAFGMSLLKLESRPRDLSVLQAAAAIGQPELMDAYRKFFKVKNFECAQLLLTWEDFDNRKRYLNAKNTLETLFKLKTVPIINENDTVSTDEIKFGDNDRLSALVATMVGADLLVILSDVDGLLEIDKKTVIRVVDKITPEIRTLASPSLKKACVGGMITKLEAARITTESGIPCVIANGRRKDIIKSAIKEAASCGTLFLAKHKSLAAKERWIAFGTKTKGKIIVDDGAKLALANKKSLLSVGVIGVEGSFNSAEIVSVRDKHNHEVARGKAGFSSKELDKIKGTRTAKEVIHRDNIVIL